LIVAILVVILLLITVLVCYWYRNRGDVYPVDKQEQLTGNDPRKELQNSGFQDYQRPEATVEGLNTRPEPVVETAPLLGSATPGTLQVIQAKTSRLTLDTSASTAKKVGRSGGSITSSLTQIGSGQGGSLSEFYFVDGGAKFNDEGSFISTEFKPC